MQETRKVGIITDTSIHNLNGTWKRESKEMVDTAIYSHAQKKVIKN